MLEITRNRLYERYRFLQARMNRISTAAQFRRYEIIWVKSHWKFLHANSYNQD